MSRGAEAVEAVAHVDYIRATWKPTGEGEGAFVDGYGKAAVLARRLWGEKWERRPWAWLGYYGHRWETICWGRSPQGYILQASGPAAHWVAEWCRGASNIPRIDAAVTVWYEGETANIPLVAFKEARMHRRKGAGRPSNVELRLNPDGGSTAYVGRRGKSSRFIRVYDKGRATKLPDYNGAIRWEVEYSDEYAKEAFAYMGEAGWSGGVVASQVLADCERVGINLPKGMEVVQRGIYRLPVEASDAERTREWLRRQVRPAISKLLSQGTTLEDILKDLGIDGKVGVNDS